MLHMEEQIDPQIEKLFHFLWNSIYCKTRPEKRRHFDWTGETCGRTIEIRCDPEAMGEGEWRFIGDGWECGAAYANSNWTRMWFEGCRVTCRQDGFLFSMALAKTG